MAEHDGNAYDAYTAERARLLKVFGENLRGPRQRRGLAQEGLAEVASVHRNEIGIVERGECEPGLLTLLILTDALEVPLKGLTEGMPAPRERRPARCPKAGDSKIRTRGRGSRRREPARPYRGAVMRNATASYRAGGSRRAQAQPNVRSALPRLRTPRVRQPRHGRRRLDTSEGADRT
jgi:transcriptional regulator with XRE-family HTH domain